MVDTHCLPTGALQSGEIPVCNIDSTITISDPGSGNRRGVIVFIHGLTDTAISSFPQAVPNSGTPGFYIRYGDLETAVVADNWVFAYPTVPEDLYSGASGTIGVYDAVSADAGHGSNYLLTNAHWWDHVVSYLVRHFPTMPLSGGHYPIVIAGFSMGAYKAIEIVSSATILTQSKPIGYVAHCPPGVFANVNTGFTPPVDFWANNWSGLNLTATALNAVTIPGIVGYGTADEAVGWAATTVAAGSNGVNVSTFAGAGTLSVTSNANMITGPLVTVTGLTGGTGSAVLSFSGFGAGTLTGVATLTGSGTLNTGNPVTQNLTDQIITHAVGASRPVTRNSTGDLHEFTGTPSGAGNDAATYAAWVASTLDPLYPVSF